MSEKRKRSSEDASRNRDRASKKQKRGFVVGPDHLPDGTYKRKTQKIKKALIERAQIKKSYAKLKRQGQIPDATEELPKPASASAALETDIPPANEKAERSTDPHPDRQTLIDGPEEPPPSHDDREERRAEWRKRKPKQVPFQREYDQAQRRQAEAEERRRVREEAEEQRAQKIEERERFRKAMAKARTGGPNGQRKLGRESKVLLEKVKRMVGDGSGG